MKEKKAKAKQNRQKYMSIESMLATGLVFCMIVVALVFVQLSVPYTLREESIQLIPKEDVIDIKTSEKTPVVAEYAVLWESDDATSNKAIGVIEPVLSQMKIAYDVYDIQAFSADKFADYNNIILAVEHYQHLADYLGEIKTWVKQGGKLMIFFPPDYSGNFMAMFDLFGIKDCGTNAVIDEVRFMNGFMIGGENMVYPITDAFESSYALTVTDECEVLMESTDEYPVPLIWRRAYGDGTVVFDNFGILEKSYRGIHGAAISLMDDMFIYPVINAATFYIDDFPSPVPEGDGKYITRDYNMSISDFYSQIWWNDVYDLGEMHDIKYTGLIIEDYNNQIEGKFERNQETDRYLYFGNMLLQSGGEIGIHGYNHMPLVLENFDYENQYDDYVQWKSSDDIKNAINEVKGFATSLFEEEEMQVYVPPSNILSEAGRAVLNETGFNAIASVYLEGDLAYEQEFDVSEVDGIVNTPRIISGYIFNDYTKITALSELNFHFVSTHFQHPDDVLDEDRGAELGWKEMRSRLADYMDWLYGSCSNIRNLTGSELAAAVERYDVLEVNRTVTETGIKLDLKNYYDEAYMLLRLNDGQEITNITGGRYEKITDSLYLIDCTSEQVEISIK